MVEVNIRKEGNDMSSATRTYALLDSGSDRPFFTRKLALQINATGRVVQLCLNILEHKTNFQTIEVDLRVVGTNMRKDKEIQSSRVLLVEQLPVSLKNAVATRSDVERWSHLYW